MVKEQVETYHFIGIGGIGMSALARLLHKQGKNVSGSDRSASPLVETLVREGMIVHRGHAAHYVPPHSIVVYSTDIKKENPEYQEALQKGQRLLHRSELLAELSAKGHSFAVAGTHGKTTTSSLLAHVFQKGGYHPSFIVGGLVGKETNAGWGMGGPFIFEADESDCSFLRYHPFGAIITNIDRDHLENFESSFDRLIAAFQTFALQVQNQGLLICCADDPILQILRLPGFTYGFHPNASFRIEQSAQKGFHTLFTLSFHGQTWADISIPLIGRHNVLNAAAVWGLAWLYGLKEHSIREGLASFPGVARRCEHKGVSRRISILDDYGHHPTEIQTTIQGIREAIKTGRLIVIFQPHRYSRTASCLEEFPTSFVGADLVILTDIYSAGESSLQGPSSESFAEHMRCTLKDRLLYFPREHLVQNILPLLQPDDWIVTMGAGDVTYIGPELLASLSHKEIWSDFL